MVANISVIDSEEVVYQILLFVEIELDTYNIEFIDEIKSTFNKVPQIQQCYYVTVEVDFLLETVVKSMQEYKSLMRKLFF